MNAALKRKLIVFMPDRKKDDGFMEKLPGREPITECGVAPIKPDR
jgi:hypothetical protein